MRYCMVTCIVLNIIFNIILCHAIGISSKLDLDGLKSASKPVQTIDKAGHTVVHRNIYIKNPSNTENNDGDGGIICVPNEGCNATQSTKSDSSDSIQTDVIVHVKTSVDIKNNKSTDVEDDTPDIPVVVGTSDQNRRFNNDNHYLTGSTFTTIDDEKLLSVNPAPVFTVDFPLQSHTISDIESPKVYLQKVDPSTSTNINIESLLLDNEGRSTGDDRYKTNTIELRVPHFESSYHNHYFGENPPPQVVWYPKATDYKPRGTIKPSLWSNTDLSSTHTHVGSGLPCSCKNQADGTSRGISRGISTGLQWYPSRRVYNPGTQIDDKLAPLN